MSRQTRQTNLLIAISQVDLGITQLVKALFNPIIVWPGFSCQDLPEDLRTEITLQRLIQVHNTPLCHKIEEATDAEALAYLYTATLAIPPDRDWATIYMHLARNYLNRKGHGLPSFLEEKTHFNNYQQLKLTELIRWIKMQQDNYFAEKQKKNRGKERKEVFSGSSNDSKQQTLDEF
ncbi:MAG: hypothetical protein ACE5I5_12600 [Candidatus Heimdallarchaeota archaeon]